MAGRPNPMAPGAPGNPADLLAQLQQNPQVQSALGAFGVGLPQQLRQNILLPEPGTAGFFGQHPRVATGLENAFMALGAMGPTSMSAGENISNVARAVMSVPIQRREYQLNQLMAPFSIAQQVGQINDLAAQANERASRAEYFRDRGQYYLNGGANRTHRAIIRVPGQPLMTLTDQGMQVLAGPDGNPIQVPASSGGQGTFGDQLFKMAHGLVPGSTPEQQAMAKGMMGDYAHFKAQESGMSAAASTAARLGVEHSEPGYLNPAQQRTVATVSQNVGGQINQWRAELKAAGDVRNKFRWLAAQPGADQIDDKQAEQLYQAHVKDLQDNIDLHSRALSTYADELSRNPNLTFDQHVANMKAMQGLGVGSAEGVSVTPLSQSNPDESAAEDYLSNQDH